MLTVVETPLNTNFRPSSNEMGSDSTKKGGLPLNSTTELNIKQSTSPNEKSTEQQGFSPPRDSSGRPLYYPIWKVVSSPPEQKQSPPKHVENKDSGTAAPQPHNEST